MSDDMFDDNEARRPSRSQRKRAAEDLQAVGERLLRLPEAKLAALLLPGPLLDAVRVGRGLEQRGAARRQRQYIGRLMREFDTEALQAALAKLDAGEAAERQRFHAAEEWRERLLHEGSAALEAFFDAHPHADRQRLRQLAAAAIAEARDNRSPRRRRELFREIVRAMDSGLDGAL